MYMVDKVNHKNLATFLYLVNICNSFIQLEVTTFDWKIETSSFCVELFIHRVQFYNHSFQSKFIYQIHMHIYHKHLKNDAEIF